MINPSLLNLSLFPANLTNQYAQTQFINPVHLLNSINNFNTLQQPHLTTTYQHHNPNQTRYYNFNNQNNHLKHYGKNIYLSPYSLNNKSAINHSTINQNLQLSMQQQQQINDLLNRTNNNNNNAMNSSSSTTTNTSATTSPNTNNSNQVTHSTSNATSTSNNATNSSNSSQKIANYNNAQLTAAFANASTTAGQNLVGKFVISLKETNNNIYKYTLQLIAYKKVDFNSPLYTDLKLILIFFLLDLFYFLSNLD